MGEELLHFLMWVSLDTRSAYLLHVPTLLYCIRSSSRENAFARPYSSECIPVDVTPVETPQNETPLWFLGKTFIYQSDVALAGHFYS